MIHILLWSPGSNSSTLALGRGKQERESCFFTQLFLKKKNPKTKQQPYKAGNGSKPENR